MPLKKELKKLEKDLFLAIEWAASEYKYLEEFKDEIEQIERDHKLEKHLRKAAQFLRYIGKSVFV